MSIKNLKPNNPKYHQGYYDLINEEKYVGPHPIIFRSGLERKYCMYCDRNTDIVNWSSEPIKIRYFYPVDKKMHNYYVDFYVKARQSDGTFKEFLVEVKPERETRKPLPPKKKSKKAYKNYQYAVKTYIKNYYKAKYAKKYAEERGMKYIILTEKSIK